MGPCQSQYHTRPQVQEYSVVSRCNHDRDIDKQAPKSDSSATDCARGSAKVCQSWLYRANSCNESLCVATYPTRPRYFGCPRLGCLCSFSEAPIDHIFSPLARQFSAIVGCLVSQHGADGKRRGPIHSI